MPATIEIAASRALDLYYANYKSNSEFFDEDDFIAHCSGLVASAYQQQYERMRQERRQEKREEIAAFDSGLLIPMKLEVKREDDDLFAVVTDPIMTFSFDEWGSGIQQVYGVNPKSAKFERTTLTGLYQLDYIPTCGVIWFCKDGNRIRFVNKTTLNLKEVRAMVLPGVGNKKMLVPDDIFEYVITTAAMTIKQGVNGVVVKKSDDGNPNKIIQTEANLPTQK